MPRWADHWWQSCRLPLWTRLPHQVGSITLYQGVSFSEFSLRVWETAVVKTPRKSSFANACVTLAFWRVFLEEIKICFSVAANCNTPCEADREFWKSHGSHPTSHASWRYLPSPEGTYQWKNIFWCESEPSRGGGAPCCQHSFADVCFYLRSDSLRQHLATCAHINSFHHEMAALPLICPLSAKKRKNHVFLEPTESHGSIIDFSGVFSSGCNSETRVHCASDLSILSQGKILDWSDKTSKCDKVQKTRDELLTRLLNIVSWW